MELTKILSSFFMQHGDSFTLNSDTTPFYGRLTCKQIGGKLIASPLGAAITGEYELVTPALSNLTIAKGMTVFCAGKKFAITALNEYTLNDAPIYYHTVLREIGGDL